MHIIDNEQDFYEEKLITRLLFLNQTAKTVVDIEEIKKAIYYAKKYHSGQKRHSGEPYYSHPIEVAEITSTYLFDTNAIIAALLHDVVEDTRSSLEEIEFIFSKKVAEIVQVLSKLTEGHLLSKEETFYKINNFPDEDRKAITIKVIDRLHNMRTIHHINSLEKQIRIAKETMQFYIPLAKASNLLEVEKELQTIVIRILNSKP